MHLINRVERRVMLSVGVVLACSALMAVESINVDRVRQRTPWNGLVDTDYTIDGVTGYPERTPSAASTSTASPVCF